MATQHEVAPSLAEAGAAAIRYLASHGYDTTTAGDLADAVGMSRSTFFRRFGSKDDVVFADHDLALAELESFLETNEGVPAEVLSRGAGGVLHLLTKDPETARLRSDLLRHTPLLRERELVITHRYERVFADYLSRVAPPSTPDWVPLALAAGIVAVHNAALRRWLRDPDPRISGTLDREVRALTGVFSPWLESGDRGSSRVVVAAFDSSAPPDSVLREIRARLGEAS